MKYLSIILILVSAYILYLIFAKVAMCVCDRQFRRKAHQARRRKMREWQLNRREYDFILNLKKQSDAIQQEEKENKQTITYKGRFGKLKILRVWYTDCPSVGYYIYPPDENNQIELLMQRYKDKSNVKAITLDCPPELITLLTKLD